MKYLLLINLALTGCAIAITEKGKLVEVVSDVSRVSECTFVGRVRARTMQGGLLGKNACKRSLLNQVRNKTAKLGGNVVTIPQRSISDYCVYNPGSIRLTSNAYYCKDGLGSGD